MQNMLIHAADEVLLTGEGEQIRVDVTEGKTEERQIYGESSCKRFILVLARRFWTICTRTEVKNISCSVLQGLQPAKGT